MSLFIRIRSAIGDRAGGGHARGPLARGPLAFCTAIAFAFCMAAPARAADDRPTGKNCDVAAPPAGSGEEVNQGAVLKIFPRISDINGSYVGCQTLWATTGDQVVLVSVSAVEEGFVTRVWSPDPRAKGLNSCRFFHGKLMRGTEDSCPDAELLLIKSMPPGCAERSLDAGHIADGCTYD
jgi:hypothetical protein